MTKKPKINKIVEKLEEAVASAEQKQTPYDRISARVMAAMAEMNAAIKEAHECAEMRVFVSATKAEGEPMNFIPQIYRLTHSTMVFRVKYNVADGDGEKMTWQQVKDPSFQDAAGQGFKAFQRK